METGINLTGYDFVVVGLILLFVVRGIWLGLLKQITGLLSICLGYIVASQYHDRLFPFLKDLSDNPKVVFVASVVILFIVTYVLTMLVGKGLAHVMEITISKWFDRMLGGLFGVVLASIVVVLMHMILSSILPPENKMISQCQTCEGLKIATDYARTFIRNEEVRKSLMQQAPAISTEDVRQFFEGSEQPEQSPVAPEQPDKNPSS